MSSDDEFLQAWRFINNRSNREQIDNQINLGPYQRNQLRRANAAPAKAASLFILGMICLLLIGAITAQ